MKRRILITPEYAMSDLAESHRMASIAEAFLNLGHEVFILGKGKFDYLFNNKKYKKVDIPYDNIWMTEENFLKLHDFDKCGLGFLNEDEFDIFVKEEVKLLNKINPDIVINGFRPTMAVSTKIKKTPYVWVLSAVASDLFIKYELRTMPYGFSKVIKSLGIFKIISPKLFLALLKYLIIMPKWYGSWNKIMKKYNLPKFKTMMGGFKGDYNLMSDAVELYPEFEEIPPYYDFCGPLLYNMEIKIPESLKKFKKIKDRPVIFFNMGSSGDPEIIKKIIYGFKDKPYDVFCSITSIIKKDDLDFIPDNVIIEIIFPAFELGKITDVALIHGGQGTVYTTILNGTPFVGIPMFNEQQWNLETLARNQCGIIIPRPDLEINDVYNAIDEVLKNKLYKENILKLQKKILKYKNNPLYYPPKIAAKKILEFLDYKKESYFDNNLY